MENNDKTAETREALAKDVGKLKQDATQIAQDVKAHAVAHVDQTKKRIHEAATTLHARVTSLPLALLGIGVFLGYVFGSRRRERRS